MPYESHCLPLTKHTVKAILGQVFAHFCGCYGESGYSRSIFHSLSLFTLLIRGSQCTWAALHRCYKLIFATVVIRYKVLNSPHLYILLCISEHFQVRIGLYVVVDFSWFFFCAVLSILLNIPSYSFGIPVVIIWIPPGPLYLTALLFLHWEFCVWEPATVAQTDTGAH